MSSCTSPLVALAELFATTCHMIQSSASAVSYQPPSMWYMEDRFQCVFARLSWCHSLLSVCLLPVACVLSILPAPLYHPTVLPGDPWSSKLPLSKLSSPWVCFCSPFAHQTCFNVYICGVPLLGEIKILSHEWWPWTVNKFKLVSVVKTASWFE